jgi:hypothetical protein
MTPFRNISHATEKKKTYRCSCCGYLTLFGRGGFEICPVCFWEDDGQDDHDAEDVRGGPNGNLSLAEARMNFKAFGATDRKFLNSVRAPGEDEK